MINKLCGRLPQCAPAPYKMAFDLLTVKVVSESRVTWATSVPILVFLSLCSRLRPNVMQQTDVRRASSLNAPTRGMGHNNLLFVYKAKTCQILCVTFVYLGLLFAADSELLAVWYYLFHIYGCSYCTGYILVNNVSLSVRWTKNSPALLIVLVNSVYK